MRAARFVALVLLALVLARAASPEPLGVMVYGGSNTWGWAATPEATLERRYEWNERWPGVVQGLLGDGYRVIEEGQNGRTTDVPDSLLRTYFGTRRDGASVLPERLDAAGRVDLVVLMVGTNDLLARHGRSPLRVGLGVGRLVDIVQTYRGEGRTDAPAPGVLVVSPPPLGDLQPERYRRAYAGGVEKSLALAPVLAAIAEAAGASFFDAGTVIVADGPDGVHLSADAHRRLGEALAPAIRRALALRASASIAGTGRLDAPAEAP